MNENMMKFEEENYPVRLPQDSPYHGADTDGEGSGDVITLPDGRRVTTNGDVIRDPNPSIPEILPEYEFTPEKEDLNLLIM